MNIAAIGIAGNHVETIPGRERELEAWGRAVWFAVWKINVGSEWSWESFILGKSNECSSRSTPDDTQVSAFHLVFVKNVVERGDLPVALVHDVIMLSQHVVDECYIPWDDGTRYLVSIWFRAIAMKSLKTYSGDGGEPKDLSNQVVVTSTGLAEPVDPPQEAISVTSSDQ